MFIYNGKLCYIEEINTNNEETLFNFIKENKDEYRYFLCDQKIPKTKRGFIKSLNKYFKGGRVYQFLVFYKNINKIIGTFFFYNYTINPTTIKFSCFFDKKVRGKFIISEALISAAIFSIYEIHIEELRFSVYNENVYMLDILNKLEAKKISSTRSSVNKKRFIQTFSISKDKIQKIIRYKI